jgi:hypothetical protein
MKELTMPDMPDRLLMQRNQRSAEHVDDVGILDDLLINKATWKVSIILN